MPTVAINKWSDGMVNDPRNTREGVCRFSQGFDALTNPHKLTPYRSSIDGDTSSTTSKKANFAMALDGSGNYNVYGLGVVSGSGKAEVLSKAITDNSTNDLSDGTWAAPSNNASSTGTSSMDLFTYYAKTGLIYGARGGNLIWAFSPTGTAWDDDVESAGGEDLNGWTYTNIAEGLVHSKDDILYVPYDNKIMSNNNGTWVQGVITIPSHFKITSIAEYGNFIAIAAAPLSGFGKAVVYLWNRDDSLTTLSESIQWGDGQLKIIAEVDGQLVGASIGTTRFEPRITFRYLIGNRARKFLEITSDDAGLEELNSGKQITDNRLYFMMGVTLDGTIRQGVWSIGWDDDAATFTLQMENTCENDTAISASSVALLAFMKVGSYTFQAYKDVTPNNAVSLTSSSATYSSTARRDTTINPNMTEADRSKEKQLKSISINASAANVQVYYRVDAGSWVSIITTPASGVTEAVIDSNGDQFASGREYEFKIESITSGGEVIELKYSYDLQDSQI